MKKYDIKEFLHKRMEYIVTLLFNPAQCVQTCEKKGLRFFLEIIGVVLVIGTLTGFLFSKFSISVLGMDIKFSVNYILSSLIVFKIIGYVLDNKYLDKYSSGLNGYLGELFLKAAIYNAIAGVFFSSTLGLGLSIGGYGGGHFFIIFIIISMALYSGKYFKDSYGFLTTGAFIAFLFSLGMVFSSPSLDSYYPLLSTSYADEIADMVSDKDIVREVAKITKDRSLNGWLMNLAEVNQAIILDPNGPAKYIEGEDSFYIEILNCIYKLGGEKAPSMVSRINDLVINTERHLAKYVEFQKLLSGKKINIPMGEGVENCVL